VKVEMMAVDRLIPYARNAKLHNETQIAAIAGSIREFGFNNPVLIDADGGIIAGHGRVLAARQLGLAEVPCIALSHLTDNQKRAYILADNRLAEIGGGWDQELLKLELDDLRLEDVDLDGLGFDDASLDELLTGMDDGGTEGLTDPDEAPEPQAEAITRPGDVWVLGRHRIMCGDSTDAGSVALLMAGGMADLCFTDPPYGVDYDGGHAVKGVRREKLANDGDADIYSRVLPVIFASTKETAALYLWFSDSKSAAVTAAVTAAGYEVRNTIIWNKNMAQFGAIGAQYKSKHEPCLYCFKRGNAPVWRGPTNEVSVWDVKRESKNEFHPTQKPVELAARAMNNSSAAGDIVLEVFSGSGSTLIAAEQTGRRCYAMELSPQYVDVAVRRWQQFTGKVATLESTGEPFPEVGADGTA
jgi:DNA modification methylase